MPECEFCGSELPDEPDGPKCDICEKRHGDTDCPLLMYYLGNGLSIIGFQVALGDRFEVVDSYANDLGCTASVFLKCKEVG